MSCVLRTRKIEIFSAGCAVCDETVELVNSIACPSCEVEVLDMQQADVAARAKQFGVRSLPAVAVDGKLAPAQPRYLDTKRESGEFVRGWNLVVPRRVLSRVWAEVS